MAEGNTIAMIWKILVPVATVILIMTHAFHTSNFTAGGGFMPFGVKGIFIALPLGVVFALEGFEQAAQLAGEARNPKRDVPIAVVGSMLMGAALYIALEVCFIGAVNPANVAHNWLTPFGDTGSFGPYYTLATSVGLGWLGIVLIIDALISPGGTALVYLTAHLPAVVLAGAGALPAAGLRQHRQARRAVVQHRLRRRVRLPAVPAVRWLGQAGRCHHRRVVVHVQLRPGGGGLAAQERPGPRSARTRCPGSASSRRSASSSPA